VEKMWRHHLLNVQLAAADGHGGSQLQVIGVVGVDLPWFPAVMAIC